jgi:hypothetical protein
MTTPQEIKRLIPSKNMSIGIHMDSFTKEYMRGVVSEYIDNHCDLIPSIPLLKELLAFGTKNTDKAMAFGITIIALKEVTKPFNNSRPGKIPPWIPSFRYIRDRYGRVVMDRTQGK